MADVRISQLPAATAPQAGDVAPMVSGGVTVKTTATQLVTSALNATPVTIAQGGTNSTTAPAARTALGLGSVATQDSNNVAITGGSVNGTSIGVTTPAPANVTNLNVRGTFTLANAAASGDPLLTIQANDAADLITISPSVIGNTTAGGLLFALGDSSIADWTMAGGDIFPSQGATTMTNGFAFVPGASGAPTGTPTNQNAGIHPLYVDSTVGAERLSFYANGSWKTVSGGGGGGAFSSTAEWSTGDSSKNAYINQTAGTINTQGIVIKVVASTGLSSASLTGVTVSLNGTALSGTYASTGTFPNYQINIPVTDIETNSAQTAPTVTVSCIGTYNGANFNISNAGTLTNVQPIPFTTTLSGAYSPSLLPFYATSGTINYSYSNPSLVTTFGGQITPNGGTAQNANASFGSISPVLLGGATIGGTATGNGQFGAGSSTVTLTGSVTAPTTYIPAFYAQTASEAPPSFSQSSSQTAGAAQGSTVTYQKASASNQYNWICTQRPVANIFVVTPFGNAPFVPDVTATPQTIGGQSFNVYGVTGLDTLNPIQLVIS